MGHSRSFKCIAFLLVALHQTSGFWLFNVIFPPTAKPRVVNNSTPPLIIVPGNLGNRLEAKIDKPTLVHWMCYKKTEDWFPLWIDLNMFMPIGIDCWIDNISTQFFYFCLSYVRKFTEQPYIGMPWQLHSNTLATIHTVFFLCPTNNYVNVSVWYHVDEQEEYFSRLKNLVEEMHDEYKQPVYLLGHSMGNNYILYFLNQQTQHWKDHYIKSFISLGAPWGGAVKPLRVLASGENDGIPFVSNIKIREEQRMTTTNPWMIPSEEAWPKDHTFISTPFFNYTNQDYQQFFKDINFEDGWYMWEDTRNLTAGLPAPGVEVYCLYGVGLPTPVTYVYDEQFPNTDPIDIIYDDGDDTVGSRSMSLCKRWIGKQEQAVHVTEFRGMAHLDMVFNHKVLTAVQRILEGKYHEKTDDSSEEPPSLLA
uniref:Phosphatidylcholine-sterol acyltransferase n=1 Tax=Sinocyclocheilus anshuiensis TaxID=1608454 RepID=A0A671SX25_9TELE